MLRLLPVLFFLASCAQKAAVDVLYFNARIYTVDSAFSIAEAMVVREGKIIETGKTVDLQKKYTADTSIDVRGKFMYPGFIDAHAHFAGYGQSLQIVDLVGTNSWEEIIEKTKAFAASHPEGWILGRGWDQNDWEVKEFPVNDKLNELYPDRPVLFERIDGHAAIANDTALKLAGVVPGQKITGGDIEVKNKKLTGILVDNAINLVSAKIPSPPKEQFDKALLDAQEKCFAVGLTTVDDCGLNGDDVDAIHDLQQRDKLKMRLYVMLSDNPRNYNYLDKKGVIRTNRLHVRGFKVYGDGALGSRGACLLEPYSDKPHQQGFLLSSPAHFDSVANWISQRDFQMCTHAIGDSSNRIILQTYGRYLKGKNDRRWRIEHAQVVNSADFPLFAQYSIIPSVQPTHATSDMYWAGDRLGPQRVKGAYAYKQLLDQNGWLPLGTDFPVEDISPFKTFYAAVVRKDAKGWPDNGYQVENALSREQALRGMTIWAARSNFEEKEKGSLEAGKFADFVVLDRDLMHTSEKEILGTIVLKTVVNGEVVFQR